MWCLGLRSPPYNDTVVAKLLCSLLLLVAAMQARYNFVAGLRNWNQAFDLTRHRGTKRFGGFWVSLNGIACVCFFAASVVLWFSWGAAGRLVALPFVYYFVIWALANLFRRL